MKTFFERLKIYAIGFGLGMVFVFFFFQNRGCSWLPDNRVKNSILDRVIVVQSEVELQLKNKGINQSEIIALLNDGDVDFSQSKKEGLSKIYLVSKDNVKLFFTLPNESFISEVRLANVAVKSIKNSTKGTGRFIHFPKDDELVFADTTRLVTCQQQAFGMIENRKILKRLKINGMIDFEKSDLNVKPKALQYLFFNDQKGRKIGASAVWYKNKISIDNFDLPFETDCQ
jgi:hypothetical protein